MPKAAHTLVSSAHGLAAFVGDLVMFPLVCRVTHHDPVAATTGTVCGRCFAHPEPNASGGIRWVA